MPQSPNQFAQTQQKGALDLQFNPQVISVQVDSSQATALVPGQAVKMVDSANGVPKVIAAAADEDDVFGFVVYDIRRVSFPALSYVEVAFFRGSVMYMEASAAIARWAQVMIVVASQKVMTVTATNRIVGRALDKAAADGDLIRVVVDLPGAIA